MSYGRLEPLFGSGLSRLGYATLYLNRRSKLLRHTSEIAYPFYIWHQTVIVIIAFFIVRQPAGIGIKFLAISFASLLVTWLLCEAIKLTNITRVMFGLKARKPKSASQPIAKSGQQPQTSTLTKAGAHQQ